MTRQTHASLHKSNAAIFGGERLWFEANTT